VSQSPIVSKVGASECRRKEATSTRQSSRTTVTDLIGRNGVCPGKLGKKGHQLGCPTNPIRPDCPWLKLKEKDETLRGKRDCYIDILEPSRIEKLGQKKQCPNQ